MKFSKITPIRRYRIFRSFMWPATLPEFARYNVIYGWNGSGKTTLSSAFRALERRQDLASGECEFLFEGGGIKGDQLSSDRPRPAVRVFNRGYVDETVFRSGRPGVPSIFYVAEGSKDKQNRIDEISTKLRGADGKSGLIGKISAALGNEQRANKAFDEFQITKAAAIKAELRSSDSSRFNNYNKSDFKTGIDRLLAKGDQVVLAAKLDERSLREFRQKKDAKLQPDVILGTLPKFGLEGPIEQVRSALKETVVSAVLERLSKDPQAEQWVRAGLPLHNISPGQTPASQCLFCEQPLVARRVAELEGHFNDSYQDFLSRLGKLQEQVVSFAASLGNIKLPATAELAPHLQEDFTPAREAYERLLSKQGDVVRELDAALKEKIKRPFEVMSLDDYLKVVAPDHAQLLSEAGKIERQVRAHNDGNSAFQQTVTTARDAIEAHMLAEAAGEYAKLKEAPDACRDERATLGAERKALEDESDELDKSIREDRIPADELSAELKAFLGREELRFVIAGAGYSIMRGDEQADHLSEGEKTAIAFLYFLKSLRDTSFDISKGVVVIDDPVSSLDANSLFCAFAYLSKRTVGAAQVILLTHNFLFLKQVKDWFRHLNKPKGTVGYYMVENYQEPTGRAARISAMDPLLRDHQSEYHYLFRKVLEGSQQAMGLPLENYYGLPNMARRLLEVFLGFRYPGADGFKSRLEKTSVDEAALARIRRFVHTYSHEEGDGEDMDTTMLAEAPVVLQAILDLIKAEDKGHFEEMGLLCAPPAA